VTAAVQRNIDGMTTPSPLGDIDTAVQELRLEKDLSAFTHKLAHVVSAIGAIPDSPPQVFAADAMARRMEVVETWFRHFENQR
jgi:hypothetical protein